jgi:two-component system, LytTR family, response regulator
MPSFFLPSRLSQTKMRPPSGTVLWLGGTVLLWLFYSFVFVQTVPEPLTSAMLDAAANVMPLALLAVATYVLLKAQVMNLSVGYQAIAHAVLAPMFATTWYALVLVTLAFFEGLRGHGFAVSGFSGPAFTWQVFQGLILYATVAATCYAIHGGRQAGDVTIVNMPPLDRYLTRVGDEMMPISVRDIVSITGAQDYAEVTTIGGVAHLVRMSLSEFEQRLDSSRFLRVHRSTIVNFDHLARTEPAGAGRMLAHMTTGEIVQVSRAGSQLLRAFIV